MEARIPKVMIADDDELLCQQLKWGLEDDYLIVMAHDPGEARKKFRKYHPDVVMLDLNFSSDAAAPQNEGLQILEEFIETGQYAKIIVITGQQEKEIARSALNAGAFDYVLKPFDIDELKVLLKRALFLREVERDAEDCDPLILDGHFGSIIGQSEKMRRIFQLVKIVSDTDATILITGESGTGKEVIARLIHQCSERKNHDFVAINCGAIPAGLLESELFGHEKGAYTGAVGTVKGKFELAHDGTLFLDEIAEMPLALQVKLLRFLQDHTIQRIGGLQDIKLNVRIIAATNKDLKTEIQNGQFREDLFYRLNVVSVDMPPLREREEDIQLMAIHFLKVFAAKYKKNITGISPRAMKMIKQYRWPGNVRELENKIRKAVILARHNVLLPGDFDLDTDAETKSEGWSYKHAMLRAEREILLQALRRHQGVIAHIAEDLKLNRSTLYDLLRKHNLDYKKYRTVQSNRTIE
ncbi:MAG: PEP-CTERM-box response regulator transcription factor [candidate division KSB1 bacterium]|nr:PEP-CTERM-box response regulator transcription factor [candidate division KSB1 bacterium]